MPDVILMTGGGTVPAVPTNVIATAGNGPIALTWNEAPGAISYKIKRSTINGGPYTILTNIFNNSYSDAAVAGGTTYYYVVSALNPSGESANSAPANATALLTIPSVPTGLNATSGDAQVSLNWNASSGATNYNIKRSTANGSGYLTVTSRPTTFYTDTGLANGVTYYYVVSAQNSIGESANSAQVSAIPFSAPPGPIFTSGTFSDNSVLGLIGAPSQELFGVGLGSAPSRTTANGYVFSGFPGTNISYGGSSAYSFTGFLGGGGTSGDASLDAVLNIGELGINSGNLVLSNLTVGAAYNVLFLAADTRNGMGTRTFSIGFGSSATASPSQSYAFQNGTTALGGYILCTFTATATTQSFANQQAGFGYQLNGVLVGQIPATVPEPINIDTIKTSSGTNIVLGGSGGLAGASYRILATTNLTDWFPVQSNFFDDLGNFNFTNPADPTTPATYFRVVSP